MASKKRFDYAGHVEELGRKKAGRARIVRFIPNTDFRCGHVGLSKFARELRVDLRGLEAGEFVVFANAAQTGLKVFTAGNTYAYLKHPENRKIDLSIVKYIPYFFGGKKSLNLDLLYEHKLTKAA